MQPTDEQRTILADGNRVIRINARAGTGKTTTLRMLAEKESDRSILYLVFNARARKEATEKFPRNVTVHTVHSLAYRHEGHRWKGSIGNFAPFDLLPAFPDRSDAHTLASLTHSFLNFFLNSAYERLEDATADFAGRLAEVASDHFAHEAGRVLDAARSIATLWNRGEKACPHDFYLKLFHKSGAFGKVLNGYDTVLVDEAQDLSPVMVDALAQCGRRIVVVGDSHQQIYGFRHAVDAMREVKAEADYDLSLSFRFGDAIADLATLFIREEKHEETFRIRGNPGVDSVVRVTDESPAGQVAYLSRSNLALFNRALGLLERRAAFRFERDLEPVLWQVLDVFNLYAGERDKVRSDWIRSFETFEALRNHADRNEDFQLGGLCKIVDAHHDRFPGALFDLNEVTKRGGNGGGKPESVLSTVHSAKGQEYPAVVVDPDVADTIQAARNSADGWGEEEVNVAYVAFTRAAKTLVLHPAFEELRGDAWRAHLEGLRPAAPAGFVRNALPYSAPAGRSGPSYTRTEPQFVLKPRERVLAPRQTRPLPKVGDRVESAHGPGTIVESEGEKRLVALDGQDVRVWEWAKKLRVAE